MIKDLKKVKDKVAYLLENHPATRDSDKLLWLGYLATFHSLKAHMGEEGYKLFRSIILNKNTPTMESIRRVRQKYQEEGKWVGTKRKEKLEEEKLVREWAK